MFSGVCSLCPTVAQLCCLGNTQGEEGSAPMCSPPRGPAGRTTPVHPLCMRLQAAAEPCPHSPGRWAEQRPPWTGHAYTGWGAGPKGSTAEPRPELRAAVGHRTRGRCGEQLQAFAAGFAQQREGMVRSQAKLTDRRCWSPAAPDGSGTGLSAFPLQTPILHGVGGGVVQFTPGPKTWDLNPGSFPLKCCLH